MNFFFTCAALKFVLNYSNHTIIYGTFFLLSGSNAVCFLLTSPSMTVVSVLLKIQNWFYVVYCGFLNFLFPFYQFYSVLSYFLCSFCVWLDFKDVCPLKHARPVQHQIIFHELSWDILRFVLRTLYSLNIRIRILFEFCH